MATNRACYPVTRNLRPKYVTRLTSFNGPGAGSTAPKGVYWSSSKTLPVSASAPTGVPTLPASSLSPNTGSALSSNTTVKFNIVDQNSLGLNGISIFAQLPNSLNEAVYTLADGFLGPYSTSVSASATGTYNFSLNRSGLGWYGNPSMSLRVEAVNTVASVMSQTLAYTAPIVNPPGIFGISPLTGSAILSTSGTISFSLTGTLSMSAVSVIAQLPGGLNEAAYTLSDGLLGVYSGSTVTPIANGYSYVFRRSALGWYGATTMSLRVEATDTTGSFLGATLVYSASAQATPTVGSFVPSVGSPLSASSPIQFQVTDTQALRAIVMMASFSGHTGPELIHDGVEFNSTYYSNVSNVLTLVTGTYSYTILRDGGWIGDVTLIPLAVDVLGSENP